MVFNIWVTRDCNLSCQYCYEKEKKNKYMHMKEWKQVVEFILIHQSYKVNQVNFHGGEPLLNWIAIENIINQINSSEKRKGRFRYSLTTNGLLMNEEIMEFIKEKEIIVSVSVDGDENTHDCNRMDRAQKGTFQRVRGVLKNLEKKGIKYEIRMTFNSKTVLNLAKNVRYLLDDFNPVILRWAPDLFHENWDESALHNLEEQYNVLERWIKSLEKETVEKIAIFSMNNFNKLGQCCGGITEINIDVNGDLFPCTFVCGEKKFYIGNIRKGIDTECVRLIHSSLQKCFDKCLECDVREFCMGNRCKLINYLENMRNSAYMMNVCKISKFEINMLRKQWMQ